MTKYYFNALKLIVFSFIIGIVIFAFSVFSLHLFKNKDEVYRLSNLSVDEINIIIDAGHGGEDGGAVANGIIEKDINLAIAHNLDKYFKLSDFSVVMTRTEDKLLYEPDQQSNKKRYDILNRTKIAKEYNNSIFVSIHQNKFEIPKYKGLQVYYSKNNENSKILADIIQKNAKESLDTQNKRETKAADHKIRILNELEMPAVLIECGFISNKEEAELLKSEEYQKKLAFVVYKSVIEFVNQTYMT